jgi:hypothetical protein
MPTWHAHFKIKDLLGDDDSPEEARRIALIVHERMTAERERIERELSQPGSRVMDRDAWFDWDDVADEFHSVAISPGQDSMIWFNVVLAELYDWADTYRVWVD